MKSIVSLCLILVCSASAKRINLELDGPPYVDESQISSNHENNNLSKYYPAKLNEFPFNAVIVRQDPDTGEKKIICQGALITFNWILTSAYCTHLNEQTIKTELQSLKVYLGTVDYTSTRGYSYYIKLYEIHPMYNYETDSGKDMAMWMLEDGINLNSKNTNNVNLVYQASTIDYHCKYSTFIGNTLSWQPAYLIDNYTDCDQIGIYDDVFNCVVMDQKILTSNQGYDLGSPLTCGGYLYAIKNHEGTFTTVYESSDWILHVIDKTSKPIKLYNRKQKYYDRTNLNNLLYNEKATLDVSYNDIDDDYSHYNHGGSNYNDDDDSYRYNDDDSSSDDDYDTDRKDDDDSSSDYIEDISSDSNSNNSVEDISYDIEDISSDDGDTTSSDNNDDNSRDDGDVSSNDNVDDNSSDDGDATSSDNDDDNNYYRDDRDATSSDNDDDNYRDDRDASSNDNVDDNSSDDGDVSYSDDERSSDDNDDVTETIRRDFFTIRDRANEYDNYDGKKGKNALDQSLIIPEIINEAITLRSKHNNVIRNPNQPNPRADINVSNNNTLKSYHLEAQPRLRRSVKSGDFNEIEHMFISWARTVSKMSPKTQVELKVAISELVTNAEMEEVRKKEHQETLKKKTEQKKKEEQKIAKLAREASKKINEKNK